MNNKDQPNSSVSKKTSFIAFAVHRLSASPVLVALLAVAVVWFGITNIWALSKWEWYSHQQKFVDAPSKPAARNVAFEKRMGLDKHPDDKSGVEENLAEIANSIHGFNVKASERIGSRLRELPDTIPKNCSNSDIFSMKHQLPTISVIVAFHNEHFITLARTIVSILHRTPERVLAEILLVNDGSSQKDLIARLSSFLSNSVEVVKTKLINLDEHVGIVGARMAGAKRAEGEVLVFLESHAEPNAGWIEPLLTLIEEGKNRGDTLTIAVPVIDIIDDETFAYRASPAIRGGFDWDMVFKWEHIGDSKYENTDGISYIQTPAFSGGVFAVNKNKFFENGAYDESMREWGAENTELALRTGMCRGRVLVTPCSRVGHVFRRRPPVQINYHPGPGIEDQTYWFAYNALRTAVVWLVDQSDTSYLRYFLAAIPEAKNINPGDLSSRKELKKRLKCNSFQWFLKELYPDHPEPPSLTGFGASHQLNLEQPIAELSPDKTGRDNLDDYISKSEKSGHLFHVMSGMCVTLSKNDPVRNVPSHVLPANADSYTCLTLSKCDNSRYQRWFETREGDMVLERSGCLAWSAAYDPAVILSVCPPTISKPKNAGDAAPTRKILKSNRWRWLGGVHASQLQVAVEGSVLAEKCLVARHFPTLCNENRCGSNNSAVPDRIKNNICAQSHGDDYEILVEPCTSDHNQLFQLLDFNE